MRLSVGVQARLCSQATARTVATAVRRSRHIVGQSGQGSASRTASTAEPFYGRPMASTIHDVAPWVAAPARATGPERWAFRRTRAFQARTDSIRLTTGIT